MDTLPPQNSSPLPYIHTPLEKANSQIRLLKILTLRTDSRDAPISIDLQPFDLETSPPYIALSYEWGTEKNPASVMIDDRILPIRRNLHDFLVTYISCEDVDVFFWIDQISIDQHNVDERNQQVMRMADVFSGAKEVISWLGACDQIEAQSAIQHIALLQEQAQEYVHHDRFSISYHNRHQELLLSDQFSCLYRLVTRPYWKRLWIAQEIALASTCSIMYGTCRTQTATLVRLGTSLDWSHEDFFPFQTLMSIVSSFTERDWYDPSSILCSAMQFGQFSYCADPRDKMYGIQSLLPTTYRVVVDYGLDTRQTFVHIATTQVMKLSAVPAEHINWGYINSLAKAMGLVGGISPGASEDLSFLRHRRLCEAVCELMTKPSARFVEIVNLSLNSVMKLLASSTIEECLSGARNPRLAELSNCFDKFVLAERPWSEEVVRQLSDQEVAECGMMLSRFCKDDSPLQQMRRSNDDCQDYG